MKTKLVFILALLFGITTSGFCSPVDLEYRKTSVDKEFAEVEQLEKYLAEHPDATYETVKKEHPELLEGYELITTTQTNFTPTKEMPVVGGFWWGCCLGIVGLGLVYLITENEHDEVRKALWGCIISTLIWGIGGFWDPFHWF